MTIACLMLAAGLSRRLGQPKQLLPWRGTTLVHYSATLAVNAGLAPVGVVVGHHADEVRAQLADLPVTCITNPAYVDGQGTSVACGANWVLAQLVCEAVLVMLCDQPLLTVTHIAQCMTAWQVQRPDVLIPRVNGTPTNPVIWSARMLPLLAQLHGDQGGRVLFTQGKVSPTFFDIDSADMLVDVDTMADYRALVQHTKG